MRLVALILLLLVPFTANAEEVVQVIGLALTYASGWWAVLGYALMIGSSVYGADQARKRAGELRDQQRKAFNDSLRDRTITRVATNAPFRYVYGKNVRVGSDIAGMFASGSRDEFKHLVCIHAANQSESIDEIYINSKPIGALDSNGDVTVGEFFSSTTFTQSRFINTEFHSGYSFTLNHTPITGTLHISYLVIGEGIYLEEPYTLSGADVVVAHNRTYLCAYDYIEYYPRVRVNKHLGSISDAADSGLMAAVPTKWASTAVLRGFTYSVVRLDLNQPEFQGGLPSIEVKMNGKLLHDPRDPAFPNDTPVCSNNPALVALDYLMSEMCGIPYTDIPLADYQTAANVCDETITIDGVSVAKYTFNGTINSDQEPEKMLESIAASMAGGIVGITWGCWAGKYVAPVMALTQDDVVGSFSFVAGTQGSDLYNGVRGQYVSPENDYVVTDFVPYQNATYVAADEREEWNNIDFPFTDSVQRVHNLCRIALEYQRNGFTINAVFSLKAWSRKAGQRITFASDLVQGGLVKVYLITDKRYGPEMGVELTLKEDAESIWDLADAIVVDETPNTGLPNPFDIAPLVSLTCSSGTDQLFLNSDGTITSRILLEWPITTVSSVLNGGLIEIEYMQIDGEAWNKVQTTGDEISVYLAPLNDGKVYKIRARAVNTGLNAKSIWTYTTHQVIGKTQPPPDMTDISIAGRILLWTAISRSLVPDMAGYIFRYHFGSNLDWNSAVGLHDGIVTSSPFTPENLPYGSMTIMGKAVDTSGNESNAAVYIITDLGDAQIENIVETFDFGATSYAGTQTNCYLVGVDLSADDLDSLYGTDLQSFYGADADSFYDSSSYAQMIYTTNPITPALALVGSMMTLDVSILGIDQVFEYRKSDPTPGVWQTWPGQLPATTDDYEIRVTIGAGAVRGVISKLNLVVDAPDIREEISDLVVAASATTIPYTKNFTSIKTVTATLQGNSSGAVTVEIDKTSPLAPTIKAYNSAHTLVAGAKADIMIGGY